MATKYKTVDVRTKKGHAQAVRLQASGWKVINGSLYGAVLLEKEALNAPFKYHKGAKWVDCKGVEARHCDVCGYIKTN